MQEFYSIENFNIHIYIYFTTILFLIGILGLFIIRQNIIIMLISLELLLLSANLNFIIFSIFLDDISGQIMSIFILTSGAAEAAVGLAILIVFYRSRGVISTNYIISIKG